VAQQDTAGAIYANAQNAIQNSASNQPPVAPSNDPWYYALHPDQAVNYANSLGNYVQNQSNANYAQGGVGSAGQYFAADAGISGVFGGAHSYPIYTANAPSGGMNAMQTDRAAATMLGLGTAAMPTRQMTAAQALGSQANGATIDPTQQAQFRQQQMGLAQQLQAQANGTGPSVAGAQLQQSTEQNLQAALAQAASTRGGNLGAAQYQLANARANITQQAGMQLAQQRMQEQINAQSMLGGVLDQGRTSDIGLALNQAQLGQQNNQFNAQLGQQNSQFNAGQLQSASAANLQAGIAQDQFKQQQLADLLKAGYSMDQAMYQMQVQQSQFNAGLVAQQYAAANGLSIQSAGQAMQLGGALAGAAGQAIGGGVNGLAQAGKGVAQTTGNTAANTAAGAGQFLSDVEEV